MEYLHAEARKCVRAKPKALGVGCCAGGAGAAAGGGCCAAPPTQQAVKAAGGRCCAQGETVTGYPAPKAAAPVPDRA